MALTLIKKGNIKIDKSCGVFNLPTTRCPIQCKGCYAKKAERQYPPVLPARERNYQRSLDLDTFMADMIAEITKSKVKSFRFHESGDFYSQNYIQAWVTIARALPGVKFYGYTKTSRLFDFTEFAALSNVNLIDSLTDIGFNFGDKDHCQKLQEKGYHLCPCVKGSTVKCMKDCTLCLDQEKVCFIIH